MAKIFLNFFIWEFANQKNIKRIKNFKNWKKIPKNIFFHPTHRNLLLALIFPNEQNIQLQINSLLTIPAISHSITITRNFTVLFFMWSFAVDEVLTCFFVCIIPGMAIKMLFWFLKRAFSLFFSISISFLLLSIASKSADARCGKRTNLNSLNSIFSRLVWRIVVMMMWES